MRLGQGFQFRQRAGLGRGGSGGGRAIGAVEHADQAADPHIDIAVHELGQGLLPEDLLVGGPGGILHIAGEVLDQAAGRRALDRESGVDVLARTLVGVHPREQEGVADPQALAVHQVVGVAQLLGDGVGGDPHVALGLGQLEEGPQLVRHLVDDDVASLVGDQAPRIDVDPDLVAGLGSAGQLPDDLLVGQLVVLGVHLDRLARVRRGQEILNRRRRGRPACRSSASRSLHRGSSGSCFLGRGWGWCRRADPGSRSSGARWRTSAGWRGPRRPSPGPAGRRRLRPGPGRRYEPRPGPASP